MSVFKRIVSRALRHELSKLDELYQRHAGEECYIFGDGVSLKWMDLRQFTGRPSIMANFGPYHLDARALTVPYCTVTDPYWFWPVYPWNPDGKGSNRYVRHRVHEEYRKTIREQRNTLFFLNIASYPVTRFDNVRFITRWYAPPFETRNPFRDRSDAFEGSLKFQVSLAIYLGFTRAHLIGHDYTHSRVRSLHFYEKGQGILDGPRHFAKDFLAYAQQHIDLTTVTLDGGSETVKAMTYNDFTGEEPRFRENTELVERAKLDSMLSWCGRYWIDEPPPSTPATKGAKG